MAVMTKQIKAEMNRKFGKYNRRVEATEAALAAFKADSSPRNARILDKAHDTETVVEGEVEAIYVRYMAIDGATHAEWDEFLGEWADLFGYDNFGKYITFPNACSVPSGKAPKAGTATGKVWEIATANSSLARKDVVALCVEAGINPATARTQYQRWSKAQ